MSQSAATRDSVLAVRCDREIKMLLWLALLLAYLTPIVSGQSVEVGAVGGFQITNTYSPRTILADGFGDYCGDCGTQAGGNYLVGPTVQVHLWRPFYLNAQALFSQPSYTTIYSTPASLGAEDRRTVNRWQVPILMKFQWNVGTFLHPYWGAGVAFEREASSSIGPSFAAGASIGTGHFRPFAEVRYTRWTSQPVRFVDDSVIHSKQDEIAIAAGVMFAANTHQQGIFESPSSQRRVSLGIKAGIPLTDAFFARAASGPTDPVFGACYACGSQRTLPYVVGPALEVRIAGRFSATAEALYSRADYEITNAGRFLTPVLLHAAKHGVGMWEAPVRLKYAITGASIAPFVSAGIAFQYDRDSIVQTLSGIYTVGPFGPPVPSYSTSSGGGLTSSFAAGPTAAIGVTLHSRAVSPVAEVRYAYWPTPAVTNNADGGFIFNYPAPVSLPIIASRRNEVQFLIGLMF